MRHERSDELMREILDSLNDSPDSFATNLIILLSAGISTTETDIAIAKFFDIVQTLRIGIQDMLLEIDSSHREIDHLRGIIADQIDN